MGVPYVLRHQVVLLVLYLGLLRYHLYASATCCIGWLHNPQVVLSFALPDHFESIEIPGEDIGHRQETNMLWTPSLEFKESFVHVVFPTQCPTTWKVVHLLISGHFSVAL